MWHERAGVFDEVADLVERLRHSTILPCSPPRDCASTAKVQTSEASSAAARCARNWLIPSAPRTPSAQSAARRIPGCGSSVAVVQSIGTPQEAEEAEAADREQTLFQRR